MEHLGMQAQCHKALTFVCSHILVVLVICILGIVYKRRTRGLISISHLMIYPCKKHVPQLLFQPLKEKYPPSCHQQMTFNLLPFHKCFILHHIMQDPNDENAWHIFLLFPQWCLLMPIQRGKAKHKEIKMWLQRFFFLRLGKALSSTFVVHTSLNNYFTFGPHLFRCAFLLKAPSFFSHLGPHGLHQSLTLS